MRKEIFVGHLPVISHTFFDQAGANRTVDDPVAIVNLEPIVPVDQPSAGKLEAVLPYEDYGHLEQTVKVQWEYDYDGVHYKRPEIVDIVTPLAEWEEFSDSFAANDLSYKEFRKVEQLVREIINAYCGQTFGKYVGTLPADGNGLDGLILSNRILSVSEISYFQEESNVINIHDPSQWVPDYQFGSGDFITSGDNNNWEISADGWVIRRNSFYRHQDTTRPAGHTFSRNVTYNVTGIYGWDSPPAPVLKAAALLIEDYICPDANYRNKYLDSIKFDQHRLDYHERAWSGTGNVMADQLLRDYRTSPGIGVI